MLHHLTDIPLSSALDGEFETYETLSHLPRQHTALRTLRRCAFVVGPVMRRRGWSIPILGELPPNDACLGKSYFERKITKSGKVSTKTCAPQKIRLRLRYPDDAGVFVPIGEVMRTMLHELTHLQYRGHFLGFYGFNAQLLLELERDVEVGKLRGVVRWHEIPDSIADTAEIRKTMMRDVVKSVSGRLKSDRARIKWGI